MKNDSHWAVEIRDVVDGLWVWRFENPFALRELLELPFDYVIVSHGEPVHTRAAYERALELIPWAG
jgi:hypothetical protein